MQTLGIAIVGCGTVGSGVAALVHARREALKQRFGVDLELRHLVDLDHTRVRELGLPQTLFRRDAQEALSDPETQVVVELVGGTGFAAQLIRDALRAGKHVVTANKKLLAESGADLFDEAHRLGLSIGWEASCGGSIPIVELLGPAYGASRIAHIHAILNGTTNYILTRMEEAGLAFHQALQEAKEMGYAEADPTLDITGLDSAHKITLIASLAFGRTVALRDVAVSGIQDLPLEDLQAGEAMGLRLKLIASAEQFPEGFAVRVGPAFVPLSHPLSGVRGVFNGVMVHGSAFGIQTLIGRGAGSFPTANAVVADLLQLAMNLSPVYQRTCAVLPGLAPKVDLLPDDRVRRRWLVILPAQAGENPQIPLAQSGVELEQVSRVDTPSGKCYRMLTGAVALGTLRTLLGEAARAYPVYELPREVLGPEF